MKITLEGVAGKRFGREHNLAVRNPNEALRALCQLIPGFREFLTCAHEHGIFFQVITNNQDRVDYEGLGLNCSSFSLVPVITGALNFSFKNIGLILVGALLVAISMGAFGITYGAIGTISYGMKMAAFSLGMGLIFTALQAYSRLAYRRVENKKDAKLMTLCLLVVPLHLVKGHRFLFCMGSFWFRTCLSFPPISIKSKATFFRSFLKVRLKA